LSILVFEGHGASVVGVGNNANGEEREGSKKRPHRYVLKGHSEKRPHTHKKYKKIKVTAKNLKKLAAAVVRYSCQPAWLIR